ncbi:MAG: hypothetical protein R3C44_19740 [Chloroflexota bacterium]
MAQRDTHPGLGNFPSSQWLPGDRFVERLSLYVPETAYTPSQAELSVGLYAPGPDGYRLGITDTSTGAGLGDAYPIGEIAFVPQTAVPDPTLPNPEAHVFEDRLQLVGYEYDNRTPPAGGALAVTLYWQALQAIPDEYEIQVRLLGEDGSVLASYETLPQDGGRPTSTWVPGETIIDTHIIPLGPELAGRTVTVQIAVQDATTGQRLNLVGEDGRWLDDKLQLSPIVVR